MSLNLTSLFGQPGFGFGGGSAPPPRMQVTEPFPGQAIPVRRGSSIREAAAHYRQQQEYQKVLKDMGYVAARSPGKTSHTRRKAHRLAADWTSSQELEAAPKAGTAAAAYLSEFDGVFQREVLPVEKTEGARQRVQGTFFVDYNWMSDKPASWRETLGMTCNHGRRCIRETHSQTRKV